MRGTARGLTAAVEPQPDHGTARIDTSGEGNGEIKVEVNCFWRADLRSLLGSLGYILCVDNSTRVF
jgi:hypothetical protein